MYKRQILAGLLLPILIVVRVLEGVDASWRPPIIAHAILVAFATHWLLWSFKSKKLSLRLLPVTVFALSAIPYPYQFEAKIIGVLTDWVVEVTGIVFHLLGRPVLAEGGMIQYDGIQVEVTEGCSGIQSLQSLIMVSLYLGEFFRLRFSGRFFLLVLSVFIAITVNVGRAISLAHIRFERGEFAFDSAHDRVGHIAFIIGGVLLLVASRAMVGASGRKGRRVKTTQIVAK